MKRIIAMVLMLAMLAGLNFISTSAQTGVIFELGFNNFDGSNPTAIVDATGNASSIQIVGSGTPTLSTNIFVNASGDQTKYLDLTAGALNAVSTAVTNSLDDITIESWSKLNLLQNDWANLFSIGESSPADGVGEKTTMRLTWFEWVGNKILVYKGANTASGMVEGYYNNGANYHDKWTHYVFTRKWNAADSQWTITGYANGSLIMNATETGANIPPINNILSIGHNRLGNSQSRSGLGTFKVYNHAFSQAEASNEYYSTVSLFTEGEQSMLLSDLASPIDVNAGRAVVQFNNFIAANTLNGNISITTPEGQQIPGGYSVKVDATNGKNAVITFGKLAAGPYKINISSNLKSRNGFSYASSSFYWLTAQENGMYEDFSGSEYVVGQSPVTNKGLTYEQLDYIKVRQEGEDKYIQLKGTENATVTKIFDSNLTDGIYAFEMQVRPNSTRADGTKGDMPRDAFRVIYPNNLYSEVISMQPGYPVLNSGLGTDPQNFTTKSSGFYHIKVIMQKDSNGEYFATVSDLDHPEGGTFSFVDNAATKRQTSIKGVLLSHIYPWGNTATQLANDSSELSSVRIYSLLQPRSLNVEAYNEVAQSVNVIFNDDLDPMDISAENFNVIDSNNNSISATPSYDESSRTLTMTFNQALMGNYEIIYNNVKSLDGVLVKDATSFSTPLSGLTMSNQVFTNQSSAVVNALEGVTSLTASMNITNNDASGSLNCKVLLATYENGVLQKVVIEGYTINAGETVPCAATINNVSADAGTTAKVFIWSSLENFAPIFGVKEIAFTPSL